MHVVERTSGCTNSHMPPTTPVSELVTALREALGLTQDQVAARGEFDRTVMPKAEGGQHKLSTAKVRAGLAKGFGIPRDVLDGYLDGTVTLARAVASATAPGAAEQPAPRVVYDPGSPIEAEERDSPLERAMGQAFDSTRHMLRDVDNVRAALRATFQHQNLDGDLVGAARGWLDAAAALRRAGRRVDAESLLTEITLGAKATPEQRAREAARDDAATAQSRERAAAGGFEPRPELAKELRDAQAHRAKRHGADE